jgi:hypothetical protein
MSQLSAHLFWDVDRASVDFETHARWLTQRVLGYGLWPDWQTLVSYYGKDRLREIAFSIPTLEPRAAAFCRAWFQDPSAE